MTSSLFVNNLMIVLLPAPVIPKKATIAAMLVSNKDLAIDTKESVETSYFVARPRTLMIVLAAKIQTSIKISRQGLAGSYLTA